MIKLHKRVQVKPHLDCWMRGERYGRVVQVGKRWISVRMFATGRIREFSPANLDEVKR